MTDRLIPADLSESARRKRLKRLEYSSRLSSGFLTMFLTAGFGALIVDYRNRLQETN